MRKRFTPTNITKKSLQNQVPTDQLLVACNELFTPQCCRQLNSLAPSTVRAELPIQAVVAIFLYAIISKTKYLSRVHSTLCRSGLLFLAPIKVSASAFYARFNHFSPRVLCWLLNHLSTKVHQVTEGFVSSHPIFHWVHFTSFVFSLDDSTLDQIKRKYFVRKSGEKSAIPGRLALIFNICAGTIHNVSFYEDPLENEITHARENINSLPAGSLLLVDLGFFQFSLFDWLTDNFTYFVSRMKKNTTFEVLEVFVDNEFIKDRLIWLGKYRSDRASYPVRYVEVCIDGEWWGYITNMINPSIFPGYYVYAVYRQRWTIECCFSVLKEVLGMRNLMLSTLNGILWQVWSTFLAYQLIQTVRCQLAIKLDIRPEWLSWKQFFEGRKAFYEESGWLEGSLLEWMCKHRDSLGLIKKKTKEQKEKEQKFRDLEKECMVFYKELPLELNSIPPPRKPRYATSKSKKAKRERDTIVEVRNVKITIKKHKNKRKVRTFG
jgi:hypothetical protein